MWEGTHYNKEVCIKCPKITIRNRQVIEKVNDLHSTLLSRLLNYTRWHIGVLQRGDHVEMAEASEHRFIHRRYARSFTICVGVDAQRDSNRLSR